MTFPKGAQTVEVGSGTVEVGPGTVEVGPGTVEVLFGTLSFGLQMAFKVSLGPCIWPFNLAQYFDIFNTYWQKKWKIHNFINKLMFLMKKCDFQWFFMIFIDFFMILMIFIDFFMIFHVFYEISWFFMIFIEFSLFFHTFLMIFMFLDEFHDFHAFRPPGSDFLKYWINSLGVGRSGWEGCCQGLCGAGLGWGVVGGAGGGCWMLLDIDVCVIPCV